MSDPKIPHPTAEQIQIYCQQLTEFLPTDYGFIFFAFPTGDGDDHRVLYASNVEREDAVNAIKEWMIKRGLDEDWMRDSD